MEPASELLQGSPPLPVTTEASPLATLECFVLSLLVYVEKQKKLRLTPLSASAVSPPEVPEELWAGPPHVHGEHCWCAGTVVTFSHLSDISRYKNLQSSRFSYSVPFLWLKTKQNICVFKV